MVNNPILENKILKIDPQATNIFLNFNTIESAHTISFSDSSPIAEGHTIFVTNIGENFTFEASGGNFNFNVYFNPLLQTRRTYIFIFADGAWCFC